MFSLIELKKLRAGAAAGPLKTNAHVHLPPNFSAFDAVEDALEAAKAEGVRLLGASNYYDYRVYRRFVRGALNRRVYPLLGMEIIARDEALAEAGVKVNDPGNPGRVYLCGKGVVGVANPRPKAEAVLRRIREGDEKRAYVMALSVESHLSRFGLPTGLGPRRIIERVAARHGVEPDWVVLQERHLARAFQEEIFERYDLSERQERLTEAFGRPPTDASDPLALQADLRSFLMKAGKPCYALERFVSVEEALELIRLLEGLPCYPVLADGASPICAHEESPEKLIASLKALGIRAAEFIPGRNDPDVVAEYAVKLRESGIAVGAGTEHNTLDRIPIEPACRNRAPIPEECRRIFWEGACVFAAHQQRVVNGLPGFEQTEPYADAPIRQFAEEGAAWIAGLGDKIQ